MSMLVHASKAETILTIVGCLRVARPLLAWQVRDDGTVWPVTMHGPQDPAKSGILLDDGKVDHIGTCGCSLDARTFAKMVAFRNPQPGNTA